MTRHYRVWVPLLLASILAGCSPLPHQPQAILEVSGTVKDQAGRPVQDVSFRFRAVSAPAVASTYHETASTDTSGRYTASLYPGTYEVRAGMGEFGSHEIWAGRVVFDASHDELSITISGVRVTGTVLTPIGSLLDSGSVYAIGIPTGSEENVYRNTRFRSGVFHVYLPAGTYRFISNPALYSGYPSGRVDDVAVHADTTLQIEMKGDPVTGTVMGRGGTPLESAVVRADGDTNGATVRTGSDGSYRLYVPPGLYRFWILPVEESILERITTLQPITGPSTFDFSMDGVAWFGTVRRAGTPGGLPGAAVEARMFGDTFGRSAVDTTDGAGEFQLQLEPGREYSLSVILPPSYAPEFLHPGLIANADTSFDIVLDPPAQP